MPAAGHDEDVRRHRQRVEPPFEFDRLRDRDDGIGVAVAEVPSGRIILGNSAMERICRHPIIHSASADDYGAWISFHADGRQVDTLEYPLARVIRDGVEARDLAQGERMQAMPGFAGRLDDAQMAQLVSYLRQRWGGHADPVTADRITQITRQIGHADAAH